MQHWARSASYFARAGLVHAMEASPIIIADSDDDTVAGQPPSDSESPSVPLSLPVPNSSATAPRLIATALAVAVSWHPLTEAGLEVCEAVDESALADSAAASQVEPNPEIVDSQASGLVLPIAATPPQFCGATPFVSMEVVLALQKALHEASVAIASVENAALAAHALVALAEAQVCAASNQLTSNLEIEITEATTAAHQEAAKAAHHAEQAHDLIRGCLDTLHLALTGAQGNMLSMSATTSRPNRWQ